MSMLPFAGDAASWLPYVLIGLAVLVIIAIVIFTVVSNKKNNGSDDSEE